MMRPAKVWAMVLGAALASIVAVSALPAGAVAEQASQPLSAAAAGLDAGRYHSCATLPGDALRCWGYGGDGALGYGNRHTIGDDETPSAAGPVAVGAGLTASAVSAGQVHTCALLSGGSVRCWGFAGNGRLGYGNETIIGDTETPAVAGPVFLGAARTAVAVTAGRAHSCAILDDAAVRCWGFAFDGRIGYPDLAPDPTNGPRPANIGDDETPGSVPPVAVGAPATAISAGDSHTCAILTGGSVRCWGNGINGQLGYGEATNIGDDETPDTAGPVLLGAGRTAVALAAGDFHTCAVLDDGNVRCWGFGGNGRLGYASSTAIGDTETPDTVGPVNLGAGRTAQAIAAGASHTCALLDDGAVRCWGFGASGQLGYGNRVSIGDNETPAAAGPVDLGGRDAIAIAAGGDHTCARLDDDSVRCWGSGIYGELGTCVLTIIGDDEVPAAIEPVNLGVPGVGGTCPPVPPPPPPPPPAATPQTPPPPPAAPPAASDEDALRAEAMRMADMRACRADVRRLARQERAAAHRRYPRAAHERALLLRRSEIRAATRRARCVRRFGRTPGRVETLRARVSSNGRLVVLRFRAPGTDGSRPPAARGYLVKQSLRPIRTVRDFERAAALCKGTCRFAVTPVGASITLRVNKLRRRTTYHYAIAARDNVSNLPGPRSRSVSARTR